MGKSCGPTITYYPVCCHLLWLVWAEQDQLVKFLSLAENSSIPWPHQMQMALGRVPVLGQNVAGTCPHEQRGQLDLFSSPFHVLSVMGLYCSSYNGPSTGASRSLPRCAKKLQSPLMVLLGSIQTHQSHTLNTVKTFSSQMRFLGI